MRVAPHRYEMEESIFMKYRNKEIEGSSEKA
jgi:hypothetical protein